jgi:two-component system phosphate regulon response regulator PhoB
MQQKAVLIVDDEEPVRRLFEAALMSAGFTVRTAEDGLDALQSIREQLPDAIVLDLKMPRMDGSELRRQLMARPHTRQIPVVLVSGYDVDGVPEVAATLKKPVAMEELISVVSHAAAKGTDRAIDRRLCPEPREA